MMFANCRWYSVPDVCTEAHAVQVLVVDEGIVKVACLFKLEN